MATAIAFAAAATTIIIVRPEIANKALDVTLKGIEVVGKIVDTIKKVVDYMTSDTSQRDQDMETANKRGRAVYN